MKNYSNKENRATFILNYRIDDEKEKIYIKCANGKEYMTDYSIEEEKRIVSIMRDQVINMKRRIIKPTIPKKLKAAVTATYGSVKKAFERPLKYTYFLENEELFEKLGNYRLQYKGLRKKAVIDLAYNRTITFNNIDNYKLSDLKKIKKLVEIENSKSTIVPDNDKNKQYTINKFL